MARIKSGLVMVILVAFLAMGVGIVGAESSFEELKL
jgi:hypothetical protein